MVWDYAKANVQELNHALNIANWESCLSSEDIDTACLNWTNMVLKIAKQHIPNRTVTIRKNDVPWYNSNLRSLKRKKDRCHKEAKRCMTACMWEQFRIAPNIYIAHLREAKSSCNRTLASQLENKKCTCSKLWWKLAKHFLRQKTNKTLPSLVYNDRVIDDVLDKCEIFSKFFSNIASVIDTNATLPNQTYYTDARLGNIEVTEQVLDQLLPLDISKASGPDNISPHLLKMTAHLLVSSLTYLINMSLWSRSVPRLWKQAICLSIT